MGKRSEKYIISQKTKYMELCNSTQAFEAAYQLAAKKGDLDILRDFIGEVDKRADFVDEMFCKGIAPDFSSRVGIDEIASKFGDVVGKKVELLQSKGKMKFFDISQLVFIPNRAEEMQKEGLISSDQAPKIQEEQGQFVSQLLDMFTDETMDVGIHRTGGAVDGKTLQQKGLYLTGHMSSGVGGGIDTKDLRSDLDRNVSFYTGTPGLAVRQVCAGAGYKNYFLDDVDIALIGIPKGELKGEDMIYYDGAQAALKPEYVIGYASVNRNTATINSIETNYRSKQSPEAILEEWKNSVAMVPKQPEYQGIKGKIMSFINKFISKDKNQEQDKEQTLR